jgi:hypothetical protein
VCGQPTKLKKLMLLQNRRKSRNIKVVISVDRIPKRLVVFLLDQKLVVGLVHRWQVVLPDQSILFQPIIVQKECRNERDQKTVPFAQQ